MIKHPELRFLVVGPPEEKRPAPWQRLAKELDHVTIANLTVLDTFAQAIRSDQSVFPVP